MALSIPDALLGFYEKNKRSLPWREAKDPYAVWVSEIMLQQTRVATVIPYYQRWMHSFPTLESLANANLEDVLSHWSGLGYYSRARNLQKGAKEVVARYQGMIPRSAKELRSIPGIGPYTAGAISSIAFQAREPLVDGNVLRVITRLFAIEGDIKSTAVVKKVWAKCEELVPAKAPGEFNQGLMELGSLVCTPRNPKCGECPLAHCCAAHIEGRTHELPQKKRPPQAADKKLIRTHAAFLSDESGKQLLLVRRSLGGLYGGLWELPQAATRKGIERLTNLSLVYPRRSPSLVHEQVLSHRRLEIRVWAAHSTGTPSLPDAESHTDIQYHPFAELSKVGLSSATKKIVERRNEIRV